MNRQTQPLKFVNRFHGKVFENATELRIARLHVTRSDTDSPERTDSKRPGMNTKEKKPVG